MSVDIKYVPLSFINSNDEILKQIKNTVIFSFLYNQYEETTLDHYLESTQYGFTTSASTVGSHRLLRITDINSGSVNWNTVPYCDCEVEDKYLLKDEDILVARTGGTTGKSFIVSQVPSNAIFASYLIRLRLKKDINIDFINGFLNSYTFWSQIVELKSGSAMPNVNAEKLKTLKLPKCDLATQNKIVSCFKNDNYQEEYIELYEKVKATETIFNKNNQIADELNNQLSLVKKLRQQLLQDAVQGKLVKNGSQNVGEVQNLADVNAPATETAHDLLKKIKTEKAQLIKDKKLKKEKELPPIKAEEIPFEIPEDWVWCRLGEICIELLGGFAFDSTRYSKIETSNQVIRLGNVKPNQLVLETSPVFIDDNYSIEAIKSKLLLNDILITMTGTRAKKDYLFTLCLKQSDLLTKNLFLNQRVGCFRFGRYISNDFINLLLKDRRLIEPVFESSTGAANQANIGIGSLKDILIPLPPLQTQAAIVSKLEQLMNDCTALEASIQASVKQNEQLLQQVLREALQG